MQRRILTAFVALTFLLVSASGCIGLLQGREYMEHLRGDVESETTTDTTTVKHAFTNIEFEEEWNEKFSVDSEVTRIGVYFKTEYELDIVTDVCAIIQCPPGILDVFYDEREVTVKITDSNGNLKYNATHETTKTAQYVFLQAEEDGKFVSGEWNINIVGTGAGGADTQDKFLLTVDVIRSCTIYPQDDVCVVD